MCIFRRNVQHEKCLSMSLVYPYEISAWLDLHNFIYGIFSANCPVWYILSCELFHVDGGRFWQNIEHESCRGLMELATD